MGFKILGGDDSDLIDEASSAGDVNGDGYDDFMVGSPWSDEVYVFFGKSTGFGDINLEDSLRADVGFKIVGADRGDRNGDSVSSAGDVNGDGYDDLIVGAYQAEEGGESEQGISYVIYGKADGFRNINLRDDLTRDVGFKIVGLMREMVADIAFLVQGM